MLNMVTPAVRLRLDEILEERGVKQTWLARKTGLSENTISQLRKDPRMIRLDTIDRVCKALNIEPGDLFAREDESSQ